MPFGNKALMLSLLLILSLAFAGLMYLLLDIRFGGGDVYPAYSSLRADPKGTKALYESLSRMESLEVSRNFDRWSTLKGDPQSILILGVDHEDRSTEIQLEKQAKELAEEGHRVIIGYLATAEWEDIQFQEEATDDNDETQPQEDKETSGERNSPATDEAVTDQETPDGSNDVEASQDAAMTQSSEETEPAEGQEKDVEKGDSEEGLFLDYEIILRPEVEQDSADGELYIAEGSQNDSGYPANISWWSTSYFDNIGPEWQVHYRHLGEPVVLERTWGKGSVVVLGDCFELSNQALWEFAEPTYIAWLVGSHSKIVFNENHLGLRAQTNLMGLVRRFRLHGFLVGLMLLGALFVWKQITPLVPAQDEEKARLPVGQQAASGLINLLNRGVPLGKLISVCVDQWRDTLKVHQPHLLTREKQVQSITNAESDGKQSKDVVDSFNQIQKIVSTRSSFR